MAARPWRKKMQAGIHAESPAAAKAAQANAEAEALIRYCYVCTIGSEKQGTGQF